MLFGVLCVWLTIRQNIWCWPTGLVQVVLYLHIFYQARLYSDLLLHGFYVLLQFYGWYHWLHGGRGDGPLAVTRLDRAGAWAWPLLALGGSLPWGWLMATFTDAALPYADAFIAATSLVAQWLMARKRLESWLFWITVDVVAIGVFWSRGLILTSGLYALFLLLATQGYVTWRRALVEAGARPA